MEKWENICKLDNKSFICPKCKYELPLFKWKVKINYEDEKNYETNMLVELNKIKNKYKENLDNNIYDNYKDKYNILRNEYYMYIENESNLLKNIFNKSIGIISLINNDNIKKYDKDFNNFNEIYNNTFTNLKIIENCISNKINDNQKLNENNINKINISNNLPINSKSSRNLGVGIKSFDMPSCCQQKNIDYEKSIFNNDIIKTNMGCNDIYNIQTRVGIPNIIDTNNSPF